MVHSMFFRLLPLLVAEDEEPGGNNRTRSTLAYEAKMVFFGVVDLIWSRMESGRGESDAWAAGSCVRGIWTVKKPCEGVSEPLCSVAGRTAEMTREMNVRGEISALGWNVCVIRLTG